MEKAARETLAQFDKGDPGWKVRMEALVRLVRAGSAAVPILVDALHKGAPSTREFSAQVLAAVADPATRPALVLSLQDPEPGVRVHAIRALRRLGRLELTDHQRQVLEKDSHWMLRHYLEIAVLPDDAPNPAAMRKTLMGYDLTRMDAARLGQAAPDFSLADAGGRTYRLSQFRGKKTVVLEFNSGDG
ncbi:MAG: HEAT repeat domain-containing protein [Planctomycetes bacterium]|nr:HEAT repeat domain-containing protein [Planctomycetota bacterium]